MGKRNTVSLHELFESLRESDAKFLGERDRRYCEVGQEREKALKIKEEADKVALELARQIQTYKDQQAKSDLAAVLSEIKTAIKPLSDYVTAQQGRTSGLSTGWGILVGLAGLIAAFAALWTRGH